MSARHETGEGAMKFDDVADIDLGHLFPGFAGGTEMLKFGDAVLVNFHAQLSKKRIILKIIGSGN